MHSRCAVCKKWSLTWSPTGRCCWAPSCPAAALTRVWWALRPGRTEGRGWGCGGRSVCCGWESWQRTGGGTAFGGCAVEGWAAAGWTGCDGLELLGKKMIKKTFIRLSINYQLAMSKTVLSDAGNVNAITAQWGWSAIRINIKSGTKGRSRWWQPAKAVCVVILSFQIHMQTFRGGREPLKHATTQLVKTLVRQETPVFSFWAVPALLDAVFSYLMKQH